MRRKTLHNHSEVTTCNMRTESFCTSNSSSQLVVLQLADSQHAVQYGAEKIILRYKRSWVYQQLVARFAQSILVPRVFSHKLLRTLLKRLIWLDHDVKQYYYKSWVIIISINPGPKKMLEQSCACPSNLSGAQHWHRSQNSVLSCVMSNTCNAIT